MDIEKARKLIRKSARLCVLTGAGISAESGLSTFRDSGGLWNNYPVEQVATPQAFGKDPRLVWRFYNERRKNASKAEPNPAHIALAEIEDAKNAVILTQNVDGLHQRAGSKTVVELHGSLWKLRCTQCSGTCRDMPVEVPILPYCVKCKGLLRPDIVWFGEPLNPDSIRKAQEASGNCDLFMVIGTSARVYPAAALPMIAARRGVPVIEINKEPTQLSETAAVSLIGKAGEILPEIIPL